MEFDHSKYLIDIITISCYLYYNKWKVSDFAFEIENRELFRVDRT
jgi:hypothetical protein